MEPFSLTPSPGFVYAGFWKRFAAYFLDYVIIALIYGIITPYLIHTFSPRNDEYGSYMYSMGRYLPYVEMLMLTLIQWSYFAGMESSPLKATIGKLAVGIYVTDLEGKRLTFGRATGRHFAKIISGITLGVGYILAGTTEKKQGLHDSISGCLVLSK